VGIAGTLVQLHIVGCGRRGQRLLSTAGVACTTLRNAVAGRL